MGAAVAYRGTENWSQMRVRPLKNARRSSRDGIDPVVGSPDKRPGCAGERFAVGVSGVSPAVGGGSESGDEIG